VTLLRTCEVLQATHIVLRILVRKHLRNVPGSAPTRTIDLNLCISSPGLPDSCHSLRGRNILVLEKSVEVQWDLRTAITRPSSFIRPDPGHAAMSKTTE
jgi:hypothetical protein